MASKIPLDRLGTTLNQNRQDNNSTFVPLGLQDSLSRDKVLSAILDTPKPGVFSRRMLTWKTPGFGYVQMYINPQSITIADNKVFSSTRTKAGYVYQYAGEDLTTISISGTTGSAGMEGINILNTIYRSEQEAFNGIAESLNKRTTSLQLLSMLESSGADIFNIGSALQQFVLNVGQEFSSNIFNEPIPTLASLAANIELFFQGVLYRGFFESFQVTETAADLGHFDYTISFKAYAKQGIRRNFMPWHKQPYSPADSNGPNPLSISTLVNANEFPLAPPLSGIPVTNENNKPNSLSSFKGQQVKSNVPSINAEANSLRRKLVNRDTSFARKVNQNESINASLDLKNIVG